MDTIYTIAYRAMEAGNFHRHDDLWWDADQKRGSFVSGVAHHVIPGNELDTEALAKTTNVPVGFWYLAEELFFALPVERAVTQWPKEVTAHAANWITVSQVFYANALTAFIQEVLKRYYSKEALILLVAKALTEYDHIPADLYKEIVRQHEKDPKGAEITTLWQMGHAPAGCVADTLCCQTIWHYEHNDITVSELADILLEALK